MDTRTLRSPNTLAFAAAVAAAGLSMQAPLHKAFTLLSAPSISQSVTPVAANSLDRLNIAIETSQGKMTNLAATGGHARIVTMFYAHCPMTCPMTIDTLQRVEGELTASQRAQLGVVLLTLDPESDSPQALREVSSQRHLDESRWLLGRTSQSGTQQLAGALGITYRRLEDGMFDHTSSLVLIDADGRVIARTSTVGKPDPAFVTAVRSAAEAS